jgi:hypothetical protein
MVWIGLAVAGMAASIVGVAHAYTSYPGIFLGDSGQYHVVPEGLDTQKLTLIGKSSSSCSYGLTLYAVDDWGNADTEPFLVPPTTVFLLTDVAYIAHPTFGGSGTAVPIFTIVPAGWPGNPSDLRAQFFGPVENVTTGTSYSYSASLHTGISYGASGTLCAQAGLEPDPTLRWGTALDTVVVHGTLVNNRSVTSSNTDIPF